jgi:arylsulfatase
MGWELFGNKAYRLGEWKIVSIGERHFGDGEWRLYNLEKDPEEQVDLKDQQPELFNDLLTRWQRYEKEKGLVLKEG